LCQSPFAGSFIKGRTSRSQTRELFIPQEAHFECVDVNLHSGSHVTGVSVRDVLFKPSAVSMNYTLIERGGPGLHPKHVAERSKELEHDFLIYG
jgi:hypothetical protein